MKNSFGSAVTLTLFGESHGPAIGAVLDGLAPGLAIDRAFIDRRLAQRRAQGPLSTGRQEPDPYEFLSGVRDQAGQLYTTGTPLAIRIPNQAAQSQDYEGLRTLPRPGHADYTAFCKYHGFQDARGGGHFSGRLTAALVCAGAICERALQDQGVYIGSHIRRLYDLEDDPLPFGNTDDLQALARDLGNQDFPVINGDRGAQMQEAIIQARQDQDSLGGLLETLVTGLDPGLGEPWFDTIEGVLAHALFSIPAVKGVTFGAGMDFARMRGSEANDPLGLDPHGQVTFASNHNGGVNGGISNGMPLVFQTLVKPTPSIGKAQQTVDLATGKEQTIEIRGRHDPALVHRAAPVVNAMTAFCLVDFYAVRYGTDWLAGPSDRA